ncbi:hypothetical protein C0Q70_14036 [Pomacea canaliculata]|uniref:Uncharacterized protein n=1 Tax=Pomacea canaliculata TaxID=400727 RepID=A0A2T7NYX0_POMCA|nr:hypothetical protein C0Q70_14036 [Pomacea canaliculata]
MCGTVCYVSVGNTKHRLALCYILSRSILFRSPPNAHTRPRPPEDRYPKITTRPCFLPLHSVSGQSRPTNLLGGVAGFSLPVIHFVSPMAAVGPLQCHHPRDDESRVISLNSTTCLLNVYLLLLPLYRLLPELLYEIVLNRPRHAGNVYPPRQRKDLTNNMYICYCANFNGVHNNNTIVIVSRQG